MAKPSSPRNTQQPIPQHEDPFDTISQWLKEAWDSEPNNADAMTLATVDANGVPNARTLLMKAIDPAGAPNRGLQFFTNFESVKGGELKNNPNVAMLFYWKSLGRQIRLRGTAHVVSEQTADAYFASRPRGSQIGAWASDQSRPLTDRSALENRVEDLTATYTDKPVPRPPHWSGYRLVPMEIEFWQSGEFRLHHRLRYARSNEMAPWNTEWLFP